MPCEDPFPPSPVSELTPEVEVGSPFNELEPDEPEGPGEAVGIDSPPEFAVDEGSGEFVGDKETESAGPEGPEGADGELGPTGELGLSGALGPTGALGKEGGVELFSADVGA